MKIKLEVKNASPYPNYTLVMENKLKNIVEIFVTKTVVTNLPLPGTSVVSTERVEAPVSDGIIQFDKETLKKFIEALKALTKG